MKVSVVIPCRNEIKYIEECLIAIFNSTHKDLEVIVVDGMSDDGTREKLTELGAQYPQLIVKDNIHKLTPFAFNIGVKSATGEFVQIIGSRNRIDENYLSFLVNVLVEDKQISCVGGDYQHVYDSKVGKYIAHACESKFGVGGSNYRTQRTSCFVDTVGVPMYRKDIFTSIGYFDEQLTRNQDDDFNYRLTNVGQKIYFVAEVKVTYFVRGSYTKLFKQFCQYGYFKVLVNRKHKAVTTLRQMAPISFLFFLLVGGVGSYYSAIFSSLYLSCLILYWSLGVFASIQSTKKVPDIFGVQFAIFILHISYGIGYLRGIVDFLILRRSGPAKNMQIQTT